MTRNMILRFAAMAIALGCLSLPRTAAALDCAFPTNTGCNVVIHIEETDPPDPPTQICSQSDPWLGISFSWAPGEEICLHPLPDPIVVCGGYNTAFTVTINGVNYTLKPKKALRWRDVDDCGDVLFY